MQTGAKFEFPSNSPHPGDSLRTHPTQLTHQNLFQRLLFTSSWPQSMLWTSLRCLQGPQTPNKTSSGWPWSALPHAKQPQHGTSGSWHCFTATSPNLGVSKPSITADHFVPPTRWPQAGHKQGLTWPCMRAPPKRLQNQHTQ